MALFGWQGLSFEHPDDWAPVVLTGNRSEGYARLAGSGRTGCQIRWRKAQHANDLTPVLQAYFRRLSKDAKRAGTSFDADFQEEDGRLLYRWSANDQARGAVFRVGEGSPIVFLEAFGGKRDSLLPAVKALLASFRAGEDEGREVWALYGLALKLPAGMKVLSKKLESGRTAIEFSKRGLGLSAQRWAFGEQLIAKHGLEEWTRALLRDRRLRVAEQEDGLRLSLRKGPQWWTERKAMACFQPDRNQIVLIDAKFRRKTMEPQWDWIA